MTLGERAVLTIGPSGGSEAGLRGRPFGNGADKIFQKRQKVEALRIKDGHQKWTTAHILHVHPVTEHQSWSKETKKAWLNTYDIKYKEGGGLEDQAYFVKPENIREGECAVLRFFVFELYAQFFHAAAIVYPDVAFTMEVELISINTQYNRFGTFCGHEPEHFCNKIAMIFCCYMPPRPSAEQRSEDDQGSVTIVSKFQDCCCRPKAFHPLADRPEPDSDDEESEDSDSDSDSDDGSSEAS
jgi:hypothetical protein